MPIMSEVASEQRGNSSTNDPEEGSSEPCRTEEETEKSQELIERLRVLEAENSALALANENQREAYERCLDEVAIHVVQALLNQKDLREECIKLKKRVFDLERQNQTLSDLFHQKLQITSGSLAQPSCQSSTDSSLDMQLCGVEKVPASPTRPCGAVEPPVNGERPRNTSTCLKTAMNSMEALSPFFKKKAHILEVLRKLKEVDPLLICPTSVHHSACRELSSPTAGDSHILSNEYSVYFKQVDSDKKSKQESDLLEAVTREILPTDAQIPEYEDLMSCLFLAQNGLENLFRRKHGINGTSCSNSREDVQLDYLKVACKEQEVTDSQLVSLPHCLKENEAKCLPSSDDGGEVCLYNVMEKCSLGVESSITSEKPTHLNQLLVDTESYLYSFMREKGENCSLNGDLVPYPFGEQNCANVSSNGTGTEESSFKDQLTGAKQNALNKIISRELMHEISDVENLKHNQMDVCQDLNFGHLKRSNNTDGSYLKLECNSDSDSWSEAAKLLRTEKTLPSTTSKLISSGKVETLVPFSEQQLEKEAYNGVCVSNETLTVQNVSGGPSPSCSLAEKNGQGFLQLPSQAKSKSRLSPTSPSSPGENNSSPTSSPSKLLKFLKMPTAGEKSPNQNHLRLSPQLTRSSKIPCRNNNYEICYSPLMSRKVVLPEGDGVSQLNKKDSRLIAQTPTVSLMLENSSSFLNEKNHSNNGYSSPKAGRRVTCEPSKLELYSSVSSEYLIRSCQKMHNYENISDFSKGHLNGESTQSPVNVERRKCSCLNSSSIAHTEELCLTSKQNSPKDKVKASNIVQSSSTALCNSGLVSQSISAKHRVSDLKTVPSTSAGSVPQGIYRHSNMRENEENFTSEPEEKGIESPQPVRRNSSSSSPPKLPPQAGKKPADSSYHPFKERLTALGKLKSTDPIPEHVLSSAQGQLDRKDGQPNEMSFPPLSINSEKNRVSGKQHDKTAGSFESTDVKYSGSADSKAQYKPAAGTNSLKVQGHCGASESGMRTSHSNSLGCKVETENNSSKNYVAKPEVAKNRITDASCSPGSPQISRSSTKQSSTQNSSKNVKSPHGSPTKLPSRSPSKVASPAFSKFGATKVSCEEPRPSPLKGGSKTTLQNEDKFKIEQQNERRKNIFCHDNGSPPYSKTPSLCINGLEAINSETLVSAPINQSAIEEKVMKGIEANMLKLQGQDRVHVVEVKQKTSSGIAGWFGRKKSKLPALSRKPETSKGKEDKREWKVTSSPVTKEVKQAAKKLEVESLNISMLMEKAEDLRRALEEEKAYINGISLEKSRLHPCDVLVEQTQNELKVMYQEMTTDNFMQQLLNRVDDKGAVYESRTGEKSHPRSFQKASHESKSATAPLSAQRSTCPRQTIKDLQDTEKAADLVNKDDITSDESLADSVTSQPFAGCGSLTRTLDSGIGTFPPPDYPSSPTGISIPKLKSKFEQPACLPPGKSLSVTRVPCKARTLERDMPSGDGVFVQRVELSPPVFGPNLGIPESEVSHQTCKLWNEVAYEDHISQRRHRQNKNWTFPNSRTPGTASDAFLCVTRDGEALQGSRKKLSSTEVSQHTEVSNIPMRLSLSFGRRASSRIPCGVELGEENLVAPVARETRSEPQSPQRQLVLETSESLSDSLYDSLSSCGSQN
ncbi:nck-associated protein 5-like isoform X2 [Latimeria chalumnae]